MCQAMTEQGIVHYDLKCDNLLLLPVPGTPSAEFWNPRSSTPPFTCVVADFGESKRYTSRDHAYTARNRGTEYIKSPEMLTVSNAVVKSRSNYDRRKNQASAPPLTALLLRPLPKRDSPWGGGGAAAILSSQPYSKRRGCCRLRQACEAPGDVFSWPGVVARGLAAPLKACLQGSACSLVPSICLPQRSLVVANATELEPSSPDMVAASVEVL